jgi:hypothetical protein
MSFYDLFVRLSNHASGRSGFGAATSEKLNARQSNCQDEGRRERKCQRDFNHD